MRFSVPCYTAAVTVAASLLAPATASAAPEDRGFGEMFPAAARLCARAEAGRPLPRRLAPYVAGIQTACRELRASFDATQAELDRALAVAQALPRPALRRAAQSAARDLAREQIGDEREAFWRAISNLPNGGYSGPVLTV
ncbi:MAG TPA: hypothetical protein VF526_02505 [Solirubrobacteraceae bacterium]